MMNTAPRHAFQQSHLMGEATPILAAILVLAFVAFTSWFWLDQDDGLLSLMPLYAVAAFFCIDMVFLRRRLHTRSRDMD